MAALQLLMLLVGSDLGLSNVRPGFIVGGVIRLSVRRLFTREEDLVRISNSAAYRISTATRE